MAEVHKIVNKRDMHRQGFIGLKVSLFGHTLTLQDSLVKKIFEKL